VTSPYGPAFFGAQRGGSRRSARRIVPLVIDLVRPRHVVDVGCGTGSWLVAFREHGVEDIWGVDGAHAAEYLEIPPDRFLPHDLTTPLQLARRFDLVVSLEVAEHLAPDRAPVFVDSLIRLGPVILFSAAIPYQGGTHHVNEQWPEYWAGLFDQHDYEVVDAIRPRIWNDPDVEWWYAQNTLLFVHRDCRSRFPQRGPSGPLSVVHPRKYLDAAEWTHRIVEAQRDLVRLVPSRDCFILVDEQQLYPVLGAGRCAMPFVERDGRYWGLPPSDARAIDELDRLRGLGGRFLVFAWPAFWWLDHYAEFARYLRSRFRCLLENERLVIFDLRLGDGIRRASPPDRSQMSPKSTAG
jgi:SAM-dependent methyltransferase